jgi:hypothetical protein
MILAAAGERIVAFARPGKPSGSTDCRANAPRPELRGCYEHSPDLNGLRATAEVQEQPKMAAVKKRGVRKSLQQPGWITLDGGFAARRCVVQNMSATGAKITVEDPNSLPAKLRLAFVRDARTGRKCEVVWRRGKTVGIRFVR